jgi:glycosyltransferase involved in cell wall biosynthesis
MSRLVVVIPCFEAEGTIAGVVRGARAAGYPVVVVDDGSRDRSAEEAEAAGATVLRHPANHGKGTALQTGFAWAESRGASAVATLDADGQHDPRELHAMVAAHEAEPRALVIGVRSFTADAMPRWSRIGNRISTYWISRYAGRRHRDTQSGFRVYPRVLYASAPLRSRRFETESELVLYAAKLGLPLVEVPIRTIYNSAKAANGANVSDRGGSHFRGFRDTLRIMRLVFFSPWWRRVEARE